MKIKLLLRTSLMFILLSCNENKTSNLIHDVNLSTNSGKILHQKILINDKAVLTITNPTIKSGNIVNYEFMLTNNDLTAMSLMTDTNGKLIGINYNSKLNNVRISQSVIIDGRGMLTIQKQAQ